MGIQPVECVVCVPEIVPSGSHKTGPDQSCGILLPTGSVWGMLVIRISSSSRLPRTDSGLSLER